MNSMAIRLGRKGRTGRTGGMERIRVLLSCPSRLSCPSDRMRFVDEFRDPRLIRQASDEVRRLADPSRHYRIMEVCGGHTHAIYRFALADLLPPNIELVHGPGCPVCVLPMGRIDEGLAMTQEEGVLFTAFGDMMRVPGTRGSPLEYKARGADVRIVYSPAD